MMYRVVDSLRAAAPGVEDALKPFKIKALNLERFTGSLTKTHVVQRQKA